MHRDEKLKHHQYQIIGTAQASPRRFWRPSRATFSSLPCPIICHIWPCTYVDRRHRESSQKAGTIAKSKREAAMGLSFPFGSRTSLVPSSSGSTTRKNLRLPSSLPLVTFLSSPPFPSSSLPSSRPSPLSFWFFTSSEFCLLDSCLFGLAT
jgi:hypothetical protein